MDSEAWNDLKSTDFKSTDQDLFQITEGDSQYDKFTVVTHFAF